MPDLTIGELYDFIVKGGATGVLLIAVYALMNGKVVPRWIFDQEQKEKEDWKRLALKSAAVTDKAIEVVRPSVVR